MRSVETTQEGRRATSTTSVNIDEVRDGRVRTRADQVATEEPMEIRVLAAGRRVTAAVTMRTPGSDFELAAGFLFGEGLVHTAADISGISYCVDRDLDEAQLFNIVNAKLRTGLVPDLRSLERHFYTSSACGVCGKASLDSLDLRGCRAPAPGPQVAAEVVASLPEALRRAQGIFESTGGLHAAGLFTSQGELIASREDVGRHNAVDKLVGWALLEDRLPLDNRILMVSGRSSYEIMQKALTAGIPMVCAVSAPSSLAVDVARRFDMSLIGFLRGARFNVYAGPERIAPVS
ncbi:MAG TPA: formate dehydrogenase accessory sulfurtransferase FdhD [Actinomycetota bacterium]|nr:formate dehydrogenase accessory sulfurtransferase FdhD [Actinomycetota bacterium]